MSSSESTILLILGSLGLFLVLILYHFSIRPPAARKAEAIELHDRLKDQEDILVVDVRSPDEFACGHIAGALNLPLDGLRARIASLGKDIEAYRRTPVYIICLTDARSGAAARIFRTVGFSQLAVLKGGMTRWNELQFPITQDA